MSRHGTIAALAALAFPLPLSQALKSPNQTFQHWDTLCAVTQQPSVWEFHQSSNLWFRPVKLRLVMSQLLELSFPC